MNGHLQHISSIITERLWVVWTVCSCSLLLLLNNNIIIRAEIKVTLSQKCCRGTVQTAMSHVCSHSNSYNWRHHVRSSLKDALNSNVFICRLNAMYDSDVLTDASRAFRALLVSCNISWIAFCTLQWQWHYKRMHQLHQTAAVNTALPTHFIYCNSVPAIGISLFRSFLRAVVKYFSISITNWLRLSASRYHQLKLL